MKRNELLGVLSVSLLVACGGDARPPVVPEPAAPAAKAHTTSSSVPAPPPTAQVDKPASGGLAVSDRILEACNITIGSVDRAPKFDFDRSELRDDDRDVLTKVAACFTTGPLRGRGLALVGRADPRGEEEYNMNLGASRAASVASYLGTLGMPSDRVEQTSRGELDANGTDEEGWQRDRRVDIDLK